MPNFCPNALQSERKYDIIPSQRKYAPLAQLDRAQASDAWCRRFESAMVCQQKGNFCPPKVPFLFIQAAGLAYHQGSASRPFKLLTKCSTNKPFVKIAKGTNIKPPLAQGSLPPRRDLVKLFGTTSTAGGFRYINKNTLLSADKGAFFERCAPATHVRAYIRIFK